MVTLDVIKASNERITSDLPAGLVAVFVGGTNGVGETTVRQFAKYVARPRVYIIGRSPEAGERVVSECKALNPEGSFVFLGRDTSLMRNVDEICKEISSKEEVINLLFLTIGTLQTSRKTSEGLNYPAALTIHARSHFITNLLPLLRKAPSLRRIVSTYGATFEGPLSMTDFQSWDLGRMAQQKHFASITTLALESYQKAAPEVSFIHNFPGAVESGIARGEIGWLMRGLKTVWGVLGPLVHIPLEEAGDRHLFLGTSGRFPAAAGQGDDGVPLLVDSGVAVARSVDGKVGSGVYSIDANGESANARVEELLARYKSEGMVERVRAAIDSDVSGALRAGEDG